MNKIILIGGDLASGKSTYSQIIAKRYNVSVFNKDIFKETFGDVIKTTNREENLKLSILSFKMFLYLVQQNVSPVIFESNFHEREMQELIPLLKEHNYDVLSIKMSGDNETMHRRFIKRLDENRNPVHKSQDLSRLEDYVAVVEELRNVNYPGEVILIDATTFDYQTNENYFKKIEEFLKK